MTKLHNVHGIAGKWKAVLHHGQHSCQHLYTENIPFLTLIASETTQQACASLGEEQRETLLSSGTWRLSDALQFPAEFLLLSVSPCQIFVQLAPQDPQKWKPHISIDGPARCFALFSHQIWVFVISKAHLCCTISSASLPRQEGLFSCPSRCRKMRNYLNILLQVFRPEGGFLATLLFPHGWRGISWALSGDAFKHAENRWVVGDLGCICRLRFLYPWTKRWDV